MHEDANNDRSAAIANLASVVMIVVFYAQFDWASID
tara:strand:- start:20991 stop:21098 length:108 start_codon:yes stop_codon:yes gene_type:complete